MEKNSLERIFATAFTAFLAFYFFAWAMAAINTVKWLPPEFSVIPENPRVLIGLLAAFFGLFCASALFQISEALIFNLSARFPKSVGRILYNVLFGVGSFGLLSGISSWISDNVIATALYKKFAPAFYFQSGVGVEQIENIVLATIVVLTVLCFFSMRRDRYFTSAAR